MTTEQQAALTIVRKALGRARVAQIIFGVFVLGLAWVMTWAADEKSTLTTKITSGVMTGLFMLVAAVLFWVALFKSSPNRSPLIRALVERPDNVLRVYQNDVQINVHGVETPTSKTNVIVQLADGSTVAITVDKALASTVIEAIQTLAPRAAAGPA